jgi:hypothetical protein
MNRITCDGCGKHLNKKGEDYNRVIINDKAGGVKKDLNLCDSCVSQIPQNNG